MTSKSPSTDSVMDESTHKWSSPEVAAKMERMRKLFPQPKLPPGKPFVHRTATIKLLLEDYDHPPSYDEAIRQAHVLPPAVALKTLSPATLLAAFLQCILRADYNVDPIKTVFPRHHAYYLNGIAIRETQPLIPVYKSGQPKVAIKLPHHLAAQWPEINTYVYAPAEELGLPTDVVTVMMIRYVTQVEKYGSYRRCIERLQLDHGFDKVWEKLYIDDTVLEPALFPDTPTRQRFGEARGEESRRIFAVVSLDKVTGGFRFWDETSGQWKIKDRSMGLQAEPQMP